MNKYLAPTKGDHFKIIITNNVFPKKDKIEIEIKFEYYPSEYGSTTLSETILNMGGSIVKRSDESIKELNRIVKLSTFIETTKRNPSKFINDSLNKLYDKAIELRTNYIDGKDYIDHNMSTIITDTAILEERGLLNE